MIEQTKLRDVDWECSNAEIGCEAVMPCFDCRGEVKQILVVSRQWGWLLAPAESLAARGREIRFEGPLENLFKVSQRALDRLAGLYHFDPWWLALQPNCGLDPAVANAIAKTNLAAAKFSRLAVNDVVFDESLKHIEHVDVGSALWRRRLAADAFKPWLQGNPLRGETPPTVGAPPAAGLRSPAAGSDLYQPTDGPLKLISPQRRPSSARITIGVHPAGPPGMPMPPTEFKRPPPAAPPSASSRIISPPPIIEPVRLGETRTPAEPPQRPPADELRDDDRPSGGEPSVEEPILVAEIVSPPRDEQAPPPKSDRPQAGGGQKPGVDQVQQAIENIRNRIKRGGG